MGPVHNFITSLPALRKWERGQDPTGVQNRLTSPSLPPAAPPRGSRGPESARFSPRQWEGRPADSHLGNWRDCGATRGLDTWRPAGARCRPDQSRSADELLWRAPLFRPRQRRWWRDADHTGRRGRPPGPLLRADETSQPESREFIYPEPRATRAPGGAAALSGTPRRLRRAEKQPRSWLSSETIRQGNFQQRRTYDYKSAAWSARGKVCRVSSCANRTAQLVIDLQDPHTKYLRRQSARTTPGRSVQTL